MNNTEILFTTQHGFLILAMTQDLIIRIVNGVKKMNEKEALALLSDIRSDITKNEKEYKLSDKEKTDVNIVLNTLDFIVKALIDKQPLYCKCFFFDENEEKKYAPIHFENYALKENKNENDLMSVESKNYLMGSLVAEFIECYKQVKQKGQVKEFCARLYGYCIDARVRSAFEYARKNSDSPTFTDLLKKNIQNLSVDDKNLYFSAFAEILKNSWGQPFIADEGKNGICKIKGVINTDQFDLIKQALEILGYEPSNDFLIAYDKLKDEKYQHLLPVYIKFLLSHKGLLDEMGLSKQGIEKEEKENIKSASPVVRGLYNRMITDLIPIMSKTIRENPKNYGLDNKEFNLFIDFLERASPATCFRILSFVPIHERPELRQIAMTQLLFKKLMWSIGQKTDEYKDLINTRFGGKYNLYELLGSCKLGKEELITKNYLFEQKQDNNEKNKDYYKEFMTALEQINLKKAGDLIKESKIDRQLAQSILSEAMSQSDIFFELYAATTEACSVSESKEVSIFNHSIQHLSVDKRLYFYALVEIMKNSWGSVIMMDGKKINVNSDQLPILMEYLNKKGYQAQNDFLTAYVGLKEHSPHLLPIYIKLILMHKGLLDSEGFTRQGIDTSDKLKEYKKISSPVERKLYNCMLKDLIPIMLKAVQEKSKSAELSEDDFKLFADLISRASPGTCFDILSVIPIHTRPPKKQVELINLLFLKFKYYLQDNPENGEELLQKTFGGKYTLLDLAVACNLNEIQAAILKLVPSMKEKKNDTINEILESAIKLNQIENVKMMMDIKKLDVNSAAYLAVESKTIKPEILGLLLKHESLNVNYKKNNTSFLSCALKNDDMQKIQLLIHYNGWSVKDIKKAISEVLTSGSSRYKEVMSCVKDREIMDAIPNMSNSMHSFQRSSNNSVNDKLTEEKKSKCKIS